MIEEILKQAVAEHASDIFLIPGMAYGFKLGGTIVHKGEEKIFQEEMNRLITELYHTAGERSMERVTSCGDDDFSFAVPGVARFRANVFRQRNSLAAVIRVVNFELPDPKELHLPQTIINIAKMTKGLVLVTGPAGSGKSTTLACVIDEINKTRNAHVITLEDPIEYLHRHKKSVVTQREIGTDTESYVSGLRASLRQAPDVILLGEMRDFETIKTAMTAAETGHLVISTLHTVGAANTIDRIIDSFPPDQQQQIRIQISMVMQAVISQQLIPTTDGKEISESDLVRQKKMDNKFGGGVFSLNYTNHRLTASLGGGINQYRGNNFGKVTWVKNYIGALSPDHEYYRNQSKKTDGNIYLKASYDLTGGLSAYADLQYRHIDYTIDGANDKYDWNKSALRPLAVDKKFDFFNPKVGLNWNINSNHRVYASFSVAQKEPTRNNYTDGDPDSYPKAEKLLDYEAGYTFANHWLTAGANFYYMDYTDQLVLTGALNDIGEALTENVPDSYRMGIELMLGIKPCKWFQWDINATWSKNRIKNFVENIPIYDGWNLLDVVSVSHKSTRIAFSPDFLLNNRFAFTYQGFEAALQSQFVGKQYMTNAEVEALTLDKYFVSNLNLAYTFKPRKVVKEVTMGVTVYNLFNEEYENNGWASSSYDKDVNHRIDSAGYAAQAGTNVMGHVSFRF